MPAPNVLYDFKYAWRLARTSPLATITALLALGLAIAVVTSTLAVVEALVFRQVPVRRANELVLLSIEDGSGLSAGMSMPMYQSLKDSERVFSDVFAWVADLVINVRAGEQLALANVWAVDAAFFDALGDRAVTGRLLQDGDGVGSERIAVIGYTFWESRFGKDPNVLGRLVEIEGYNYTIIGVTSRWFSGLSIGVAPDIYIPLSLLPELNGATGLMADLADAAWLGISVGGRLTERVSRASACAQLNSWWPTMLKHIVPASLSGDPRHRFLERRLSCDSAAYGINRDQRIAVIRPYYVLVGVAVVMVLVGALHLATLMLHQASRRAHETALKLALGASRALLVREVLVSNALIASLGVLVGIVLSLWGTHLIVQVLFAGAALPPSLDTSIRWKVLCVALILILLVTAVSTVTPALFVLRQPPMGTLKARHSRAGAKMGLWARALIAGQIAALMPLLTITWTLFHSTSEWTSDRSGFDRDGLIVARLYPQPQGYEHINDEAYYRQLVEGLSGISGVASVGLTNHEPGGTFLFEEPVATDVPGSEPLGRAGSVLVSPELLQSVGVDIIQGRQFSWADSSRSERVAIMGGRLARELFPDGAIGRRMRIGERENERTVQVVGVATDVSVFDVRNRNPRIVYLPWLQQPELIHWSALLAIRTNANPQHVMAEVRHTVTSLRHEYVMWISSAKEVTRRATANERLAAGAGAFFAVVAVVLMLVGLFGSVSHHLAMRAKEIAIRVALGASGSAITRKMLGDIAALVMAGVVIGAPLSWSAIRVLQTRVEGLVAVEPFSAPVGVIASSILVICIVAAYIFTVTAAKSAPSMLLRE